jgi:hypothetical protein
MKLITEYTIVENWERQTVIDQVNALLLNEWELYGNLCMSDRLFAQALKRRVFINNGDEF